MAHPHLVLWTVGLFVLIAAVRFARNHELRRHHLSVLAGALLFSASTGLALLDPGRVSRFESVLFLSFLVVLITGGSGVLFHRGRVSRGTHRTLAIAAIALAALVVLMAVGVL